MNLSDKPTFLRRPEEWETWILVVKTLAGDSWRYIDPTTVEELDAPVKPRPADFGGTNASDIDANQREHWIEFNKLYHQEIREYDRKKARIDKAEEYIITHIDKSYLLQKANHDALRDFLKSLKRALAPSDATREQTTIDCYVQACKFDDRNVAFDTWQHEYLVAYLRAKEANIPDVSGDRAHWHVVKVIKKLDPSYAAVISMQITSGSPATLSLVEDILSAFSQHYRRTTTHKPPLFGSAYAATLQGEESPYKTQGEGSPHQKKRQTRCPCGDFHIWGACLELVEAIRPQGFTPNPRKQENIRDFCKDPERNKIVAEVRLRARRYHNRDRKQQYRNQGDNGNGQSSATQSSTPQESTPQDSNPDYIEIDAGDELF